MNPTLIFISLTVLILSVNQTRLEPSRVICDLLVDYIVLLWAWRQVSRTLFSPVFDKCLLFLQLHWDWVFLCRKNWFESFFFHAPNCFYKLIIMKQDSVTQLFKSSWRDDGQFFLFIQLIVLSICSLTLDFSSRNGDQKLKQTLNHLFP